MKNHILTLFIVIMPFMAYAQKHRVYGDAGFMLISPNPGISLTYNYKLAKYIGSGLGIQAYRYAPTIGSNTKFVSAVFIDLHLNIRPGKKNQFFTFLDLGMNFYKRATFYIKTGPYDVYKIRHDNGMYFGLGMGYMRRITSRGSGIYLSLKAMTNTYITDRYDPYTLQPMSAFYNFDTGFTASLGYRF